MSKLNKVYLSGFLGNTPEPKMLNSNTKFARLRVAVDASYKVNNEWVNKSKWVTVTCFGRAAERAGSLQKGSRIMIEGELDTYTGTDKSGNAIEQLNVKAQWIESFERSNQKDRTDDLDAALGFPQPEPPACSYDDIPF